jgi:hypothetical protein
VVTVEAHPDKANAESTTEMINFMEVDSLLLEGQSGMASGGRTIRNNRRPSDGHVQA